MNRLKVAAPAWLLIAFLVASCAAGIKALKFAGGCAPGVLAAVMAGIRDGGPDWVGVINGGLSCVPAAIAALQPGEGASNAPNSMESALRRARMDMAAQLHRLRYRASHDE